MRTMVLQSLLYLAHLNFKAMYTSKTTQLRMVVLSLYSQNPLSSSMRAHICTSSATMQTMYIAGAIYIQKEFTLSGNICFFAPLIPSISSVLGFNMSLNFQNNTAQKTGDALYGGMVDKCPLLNTLSPSPGP